jgi:hypothetical protein
MSESQSTGGGKETGRPPRQPHGPGVLIVFGLALTAVAIWCGIDAFGAKGDEWRETGETTTLMLNYAGAVIGGVGALYCFVMAAVRARKGAGEAEAPFGPPQPPAESDAEGEAGEDKAPGE